jgi:hypothetical protein
MSGRANDSADPFNTFNSQNFEDPTLDIIQKASLGVLSTHVRFRSTPLLVTVTPFRPVAHTSVA